MHVLGVICFFTVFAVYAAGMGFFPAGKWERWAALFVRYFQTAKKDIIGLMIGWVVACCLPGHRKVLQ